MPKKKNKQSNYYHVGKGIKPTITERSAPFKGEPNTYIDSYNIKSGEFHRRRVLDNSGNFLKDYDARDEKHTFDHIHVLNGLERTKKGRIELTKKEKAVFKKAKKKRRPYNG